MKNFISIAQMVLARLTAGQTITDQGYIAAGGGGEGQYLVVPPQAFDGYGDHELANGNIAVLQNEGSVYVTQFGASPDNTGAENSVAFQAALDYIYDANNGSSGGEALVPPGLWDLEDGLTIKSFNALRSVAGSFATILNFTSTTPDEICCDLGNSDDAMTKRPKLEGFQIRLVENDTVGIRLRCTEYGQLSDIEIQGTTPNINVGVILWGGDISNYFNHLKDVYPVHINTGFRFDSDTGTVTVNYFDNCSCYGGRIQGAVDSIGYEFLGDNGDTTQILGGNVENCTTGIRLSPSGTDKISAIGVRFEANTEDIDLGTGSFRNNFISMSNLSSVTDDSDTNTQNIIIGNGGYNNIPFTTPRGNWSATNVAIGDHDTYDGMSSNGTRKNNFVSGVGSGYGIAAGTNNSFHGNDIGGTAEWSQSSLNGYSAAGNATGSLTGVTLDGAFAGLALTTGADWNTLIGNSAGRGITTGPNNICVGLNAGHTGSPFPITTESNRIVVGDDNKTNAYIKVAWTVTSDIRDKTDIKPLPYGLDFLSHITPISFRFDDRSRYKKDNKNPDGSRKDKSRLIGFSAQEMLVAEDLLRPGKKSLIVNDDDPDNLKITPDNMLSVLVNAVKELSTRISELELQKNM